MPYRLPRLLAVMLAASLAIFAASPAFAIRPGHWNKTTEADFAPGATHHTVVTNLGDIKLTHSTKLLAKMPPQATVLYDIRSFKGSLYLAAGPQGMLLRRHGKKTSVLVKLKDEQIFALNVYHGKLLVAVSGSPSRLSLLEHGKLVTLVKLPKVRYIWDTLVQGNTIIAATGTHGKIFAITPPKPHGHATTQKNGKHKPIIKTILHCHEANILCLGQDGKGRIYAGTDTNGLVYRLTKQKNGHYTPYVLYDAPEPEIGALLVMKDGTVYAGTANAKQARPGRLKQPRHKQTGRPISPKAKAKKPGKPPHTPPSPKPLEPASKSGAKAPAKPHAAAPKPAPAKSVLHQQKTKSAHPNVISAPSKQSANLTPSQTLKRKLDHKPKVKRVKHAKPTPAQYDRLRQIVQQRLDQARKTGVLPSGPQQQPFQQPARRAASTGPSRVQPASNPQPRQPGNAIYRIDPQGFVRQVFRESVMILKIIKVGHQLIVGTGNQGQLYSVNPNTEETTILTKLQPEQIPAIATDSKGRIIIGTANPAHLLLFSRQRARRGTYTSPVMDASQISLWGKLNITATVPHGTSVTVETRSGNVADPQQGGWSKWSTAQVFVPLAHFSSLQPRPMTIQSPPARFLQYRLTLIGTSSASPVVHSVDMAYVTPNLRPEVTSIDAHYPSTQKDSPPSTVMHVRWKAHDPNKDHLIYKLAYRRAGSHKWIRIDKNIDQSDYEWQTRQVPDGYYRLRVTASDSPDNPPDMAMTDSRESNAVLVDNQPPRLIKLKHSVHGQTLSLAGIAVDDYSDIQYIGYVVDSHKHYHIVLPNDLIFDSTREPWHVKIRDLAQGPHVVTLRITDARGNSTYRSVAFNVK